MAPSDGPPQPNGGPGRLKVGELAHLAGLTVRTLHHYEEVGLLEPAGRTGAGHRYYGPAELRRLHRIVALRQLGLTLDEIGRALEGRPESLARTLRRQIGELERRIREARALRGRLEDLVARLESGGAEEVSIADLADSLRATVELERYYSPVALRELEARRRAAGAEGMEEGQAAWASLLAEFEGALDTGLPSDSPHVLALARRARDLVEAFTGGDPEIHASLERLYRLEGPDQVLRGRGVPTSPELWSYMQEARRCLETLEADPA